MRLIRAKDTTPEVTVRRIVHGMGYRYRLHVAKLPGKPDLVFARLRRIVDVRGCFWHQHPGCIDSHIPKSRRTYWRPKLRGNVRRDALHGDALKRLGWRVLVVWACECEDANLKALKKRLKRFLGT